MAKNIKPERGTYVSRSVYQKVVEENNRLKRDLYIICMGDDDSLPNSIDMQLKWREKFTKDAEWAQAFHDYAVQYVKDNPDSVVAQIAREFPPKSVNPK